MSFRLINKTLRINNLKTRTAMNAKILVLLFVLKRSYICYYIICLTVPSTITVTVAKLQIYTFTIKEWGGCRYYRAFSTILFRQMLLQLVLWNKKVPLKERGYSDSLQINISFKISRNNHRPFVTI